MKKQILIALALVFCLTGCKKEIPTSTETSTTESKTETSPTDCYSFSKEGNSVELQLQYNAEDVTGTLIYDFAEKDGNSGTFRGKLQNNILLADYAFQSEGVKSTRQVAFKLIDDQFVEGYGDFTSDGTKFVDATKLEFTSTMPLSKTDCPK